MDAINAENEASMTHGVKEGKDSDQDEGDDEVSGSVMEIPGSSIPIPNIGDKPQGSTDEEPRIGPTKNVLDHLFRSLQSSKAAFFTFVAGQIPIKAAGAIVDKTIQDGSTIMDQLEDKNLDLHARAYSSKADKTTIGQLGRKI